MKTKTCSCRIVPSAQSAKAEEAPRLGPGGSQRPRSQLSPETPLSCFGGKSGSVLREDAASPALSSDPGARNETLTPARPSPALWFPPVAAVLRGEPRAGPAAACEPYPGRGTGSSGGTRLPRPWSRKKIYNRQPLKPPAQTRRMQASGSLTLFARTPGSGSLFCCCNPVPCPNKHPNVLLRASALSGYIPTNEFQGGP